MPAGLVGTVMLTIRGRVRPAVASIRAARWARRANLYSLWQGIGKRELVAKVVWLKSAIEARGGKVADFGDMTVEEVVDRSGSAHAGGLYLSPRKADVVSHRALLVLKDLIGEQQGLIEPTYHPISRFELSFYRNQVCACPESNASMTLP